MASPAPPRGVSPSPSRCSPFAPCISGAPAVAVRTGTVSVSRVPSWSSSTWTSISGPVSVDLVPTFSTTPLHVPSTRSSQATVPYLVCWSQVFVGLNPLPCVRALRTSSAPTSTSSVHPGHHCRDKDSTSLGETCNVRGYDSQHDTERAPYPYWGLGRCIDLFVPRRARSERASLTVRTRTSRLVRAL